MDAAVAPAEVARAAKLFAGFADRTRLSLLMCLLGGEARVSDLVERLDGSQGNISGHLRCLKDCGMVEDRRAGREVYYRIAHSDVVDLLRAGEVVLERTGHAVTLCPNEHATSGP